MLNIIIGNWKQNPQKLSDAKKIAVDTRKLTAKLSTEIVLCPPFPFLSTVTPQKRFALGAQDVSFEKEGAHTGEVSAKQLKSVGVSYVIIGHSERRAMGESSETIAKKANGALKAGMSPVICIGEKERHHDGAHWQTIGQEIHASLAGITRTDVKKVIIAYEPIWAIGGKSLGAMKTEDIAESMIFIRKVLAEIYGSKAAHGVRIIYGGSVDHKNAAEIAKEGGVSGFLVGRQSLKPKDFAKIAEALQ
ncbi:MAG: triose-phosphate isomerase [Candidatus Paceibacterota bacterium]|jgi:triosephosphate isomerase